MNFLGHLLITYPHRDFTMGNLLGDMMRSSEALHLNTDLQYGIQLHREIDRYTDSHTDIRSLTGVLRPRHGKYAPVVVDILLDHILVHQWDEHAELPYTEFTQWVYTLIAAYIPQLPSHLAERLSGMVRYRWIDDFGAKAKLREVLFRMDRRARFPSRFLAGMEDVMEHYTLFDETFRQFYPDIRTMLKPHMLGMSN